MQIVNDLYKVEFSKGLDVPGVVKLETGIYYLTHSDMPAYCAAAERGSWEILGGLNTTKAPDPSKPMLVVRPGGFGDILFLSSAARRMKAPWWIACHDRYFDVLESDHLLSYPLTDDAVQKAMAVRMQFVSADLLFESSPKNSMVLASGLLGLNEVAPMALPWLTRKTAGSGTTAKVAVHLGASWSGRTPEMAWWRSLLRALPLAADGIVYLIGSTGQYGPEKMIHGCVNCTAENITFRQSLDILSACHLFIGPDSALLHVAEAIGVPYVGLYGPIHWRQRSTGEGGRNFIGNVPCAACNFHPHGFREWPAYGPCMKTKRCEALAAISVERVLGAAHRLLNGETPEALAKEETETA